MRTDARNGISRGRRKISVHPRQGVQSAL